MNGFVFLYYTRSIEGGEVIASAKPHSEGVKNKHSGVAPAIKLLYNVFVAKKLAVRRGVEQLAARKAHNLEVGGSSPSPATILWINHISI